MRYVAGRIYTFPAYSGPMLTLSQVLSGKLVPWAQREAGTRFIVAHPELANAPMPEGVQLTSRPLLGKRVAVKGRHYYHNTRSVVAVWPEMALNEIDKFKLACVINGHIDYQLGEQRVQCGPGHFLFIPPRTPHPDGTQPYIDTARSTFCDVLFFMLHPNAIECWVSHFDERGRGAAGKYMVQDESTHLIFRALATEAQDNGDDFRAVGAALLSAFFVTLLHKERAGQVQRMHGAYRPAGEGGGLEEGSFTTRLHHYVEANLRKKLSLDEVARDLFLSRAQFTRTVRRETGLSFNEFLLQQRLIEAQNLLRDSQWSVAAIADFVGFRSVSHFRTAFRQTTGSTPLEYRRLSQKTANDE